MLNLYTGHFVRITWNGLYSRSFLVENGVKQGTVISPVMLCIYVDKLLCELHEGNGIGCFIGKMIFGALVYADNIVPIAPTPRAMRRMLSTCIMTRRESMLNKSRCMVQVS